MRGDDSKKFPLNTIVYDVIVDGQVKSTWGRETTAIVELAAQIDGRLGL